MSYFTFKFTELKIQKKTHVHYTFMYHEQKTVNFFEQRKERHISLWKHQSRRDLTCCPISIAICPYCSPARWRACHSEALREELEGLNPPINVCIPLMNVPTFPPRSFTAPCRWTCVRKQILLYPVLPVN